MRKIRISIDPYEDLPASHATHHATREGPECQCHGKTEAEIARPYAMFAFSLPIIIMAVVLFVVVFTNMPAALAVIFGVPALVAAAEWAGRWWP
jgi:hypothetical protein